MVVSRPGGMPGIWAAGLRVDAFSQGRDLGVVGFGWSEPHVELPTPESASIRLA